MKMKKNTIRAKKLTANSKIGLIAPAGPISADRLDLAIRKINEMGFRVEVGKSCAASGNSDYSYLSADDKTRADDINNMFLNKEIEAIFAVRGGYGSNRILNQIDYAAITKNPKIFCGYSDITAINIAIFQKTGLITYHAPMFGTELYKSVDNLTYNSFSDCLFKNDALKCCHFRRVSDAKILIEGYAEGKIIGGNLSLLISSIGTEFEFISDGKILFIEEIGEDIYKIDRMLTQLKHSGKLKKALGIVFGHFTSCSKNEKENEELAKLFREFVSTKNIPAIMNFPIGHSMPTFSMPIGEKAILSTAKKYLCFAQYS